MADVMFTVTRVDVTVVGDAIFVVKFATDDAGNVVEVKSETDKTTTDLRKYFESRGWYYTGHSSHWDRDAHAKAHVFGYMPKPGATRLTVKTPVWIDPWGDVVVGA